WNKQEVTALLEYLNGYKAEAGNGSSFKMSTLNAAEAHIQQHLTQGPVKIGKMCKTKWNLKSLYTTIETYNSQSGVHWEGANI
ncbi:hypothetical protein L208DRAFT_1117810, partial [Tricholoma matsutake]